MGGENTINEVAVHGPFMTRMCASYHHCF